MAPLYPGTAAGFAVRLPRREASDRLPAMIRWFLFAAGVLAYLASLVLARFPRAAEAWYGSFLGIHIPFRLSRITDFGLTALAPWVIVGLVVAMAFLGRRDFRAARRDGAGRPAAVAKAMGWPLGILGGTVFVFYLGWGFNYARPPLEDRLGLPDPGTISAEELERLAREAISQANGAYRELHEGAEDIGEPTPISWDLEFGSRALEGGWRGLVSEWDLPSLLGGAYGPVKARGVSHFLDAFDISGVYFPFTGEALVNQLPPAVALPAVMAHEQAHQRGFAPENEASFMGLMAAIRSWDPLVRYSAWARMVRQFAGDLDRLDRDVRSAVVEDLLPGVRRDWQDLADYYQENRSPAAPVARAMNDRYLRAHGVQGGIQSYDRVTLLLVAWSRTRGGVLDPGDPPVEGP